jgi:hypothetical protein
VRARCALAAAGALLFASPAALAAPRTGIPFPSAILPLTQQPPLRGAPGFGERRFPRSVRARERVVATLGRDGRALAVRVLQRLEVVGKGDYTFVVPAPATDVSAAPGSESQPGLRTSGVVWQGFSSGRRVLAADIRLRARAAGPALPLRISVRATAGGQPLLRRGSLSGPLDVTLRVVNATPVSAGATLGKPAALDVARTLDGLRAAVRAGTIPLPQPVLGTDAHSGTIRAVAPIRVSGEIAFPEGSVEGLTARGAAVSGGHVRFSGLLGDGGPLELTVHLRGTARGAAFPRVTVDAAPVSPARLLTPPGARSWVEAVRNGRGGSGADLLVHAAGAVLAYARAHQYTAYLASPDPRTPVSTSYRFVVVPAAAVPRATLPAPLPDDGTGALTWILASVGGVLAAGGLAVLWAHL